MIYLYIIGAVTTFVFLYANIAHFSYSKLSTSDNLLIILGSFLVAVSWPVIFPLVLTYNLLASIYWFIKLRIKQ